MLFSCNNFKFSNHALKAMIARSINADDVIAAVKTGEVIREYPDDKPYPSFLMLKFINNRPYHVVVGQISEGSICIIITCYEPDATLWDNEFKNKIR